MRTLGFLLVLPALILGFLLGGKFAGTAARAGEGDGPGAGPEPASSGTRGGVAVPVAHLEQGGSEDPMADGSEPRTGHREVAVDPGDVADASAEDEPEEEGTPSPPELMDLLRKWIESGAMERQYENDPDSLAYFLLYQFIEEGDPFGARQVLEVHEMDASAWGSVGSSLRGQGQLAAAAEVLLEALRMDPASRDWIGELKELDPAGALAIVEAAIAENPDLERAGAGATAIELLLASGQTDEALRRLDALFAEDFVPSHAWELLSTLEPEVAEERLRRLASEDPFGDARIRLARMLVDSERGPEAVELLRDLLRENPSNWDAISMLQGVDPEGALAMMQERVASQPGDASAWGNLGDQLLALERPGEAVEAWIHAWEANPSNTSWIWRLKEHAPDRFWPMIHDQAERTNDDELFGDMADALWQEGRHEEARIAWERARKIDPDDGEWTGKLQNLAQGNDPLGMNGPTASMLGGYGQFGLSEEMFLNDIHFEAEGQWMDSIQFDF